MNEGYKLELYTSQLYKDLGKIRVVHNVQYNMRRIISGNLIAKVQVDIEYYDLPLRKMTVECKYHERVNVGPEQMEEFIEKLGTLQRDYAVMVTNSEFSSPAARLAGKKGISLIDHDRLVRMDRKRLGLFSHIFHPEPRSLEQQIRSVEFREEYLRPRIRTEYVLI